RDAFRAGCDVQFQAGRLRPSQHPLRRTGKQRAAQYDQLSVAEERAILVEYLVDGVERGREMTVDRGAYDENDRGACRDCQRAGLNREVPGIERLAKRSGTILLYERHFAALNFTDRSLVGVDDRYALAAQRKSD